MKQSKRKAQIAQLSSRAKPERMISHPLVPRPFSPAFGGIHSSDDSQHADARKAQVAIQRANRVKRRAGELPQPMSSIETLIRQRNPSPSPTLQRTPTPLTTAYFMCTICNHYRASIRRVLPGVDNCVYCRDFQLDGLLKYCCGCHQEMEMIL